MQEVRGQCANCERFLPVHAQVIGCISPTIQKSLQAHQRTSLNPGQREREVFEAVVFSFPVNDSFLSLVPTLRTHLHSWWLMAAESLYHRTLLYDLAKDNIAEQCIIFLHAMRNASSHCPHKGHFPKA